MNVLTKSDIEYIYGYVRNRMFFNEQSSIVDIYHYMIIVYSIVGRTKSVLCLFNLMKIFEMLSEKQ